MPRYKNRKSRWVAVDPVRLRVPLVGKRQSGVEESTTTIPLRGGHGAAHLEVHCGGDGDRSRIAVFLHVTHDSIEPLRMWNISIELLSEDGENNIPLLLEEVYDVESGSGIGSASFASVNLVRGRRYGLRAEDGSLEFIVSFSYDIGMMMGRADVPQLGGSESVGSAAKAVAVSQRFLNCVTRSFTQPIGEGAYGVVYRGLDPETNQELCVKVSKSESGRNAMQREVDFLDTIRHPYIIRLLGHGHVGPRRCLVYALGRNGSLANALRNKADELSWPRRMRIASGLTAALAYMWGKHGMTGLHRDIKPDNVVLSEVWAPKLIDCGLSKLFDGTADDVKYSTMVNGVPGSLGYMCPAYMETGSFAVESEIYALGVLFAALFTGAVYGKRTPRPPTLHPDRRISRPTAVVSDIFPVLVVAMTMENPARRPSFAVIMRHLRECLLAELDDNMADSTGIQGPHMARCSLCLCSLVSTADGAMCSHGHVLCPVCIQNLVTEATINPTATRIADNRLRCRVPDCTDVIPAENIHRGCWPITMSYLKNL